MLEIQGRASGLIGLILSLLRISPLTTLTLMFDRIELTQSKISSQSRRVFPLCAVESTECGHKRNVGFLVTASVFFVIALSMLTDPDASSVAPVPAIVGLVLVLAFFFSRKLFLGIYCRSQTMELVFKESKINGQKINREVAMAAIRLIDDRLIENQANS